MNPISVSHQQAQSLQGIQSSQGGSAPISEKGTSNFQGHKISLLDSSGSMATGIRQAAENLRTSAPFHSDSLKSLGQKISPGTGPTGMVALAQKHLGQTSSNPVSGPEIQS